MKNRSFLGVIFGFVILLSLNGQTMTLVNFTEGLVYYGTSPITESEYRRLLDNPNQFKTWIQDASGYRGTIAPNSLQTQVEGFTNDTLVYGFIILPGENSAPLFQFRVAPNQLGVSYAITENTFLVDAQGRTVGLSPFEVPVSESPLLVDRRFLDWISIPDGRRFPQSYLPSQVTLRYGSETGSISLGESQFWQKGGTQLDRIKVAAAEKHIYFMLSGYQTLSRGTRYIFRYYEKISSPNLFTIEIPLGGFGGPVFLWTSDAQTPTILGQFAASNFSLEAAVDRQLLQDLFGVDLTIDGLWEVSSAGADAGIYEEFYYGSLENREFFIVAQ
ncbi:MAG: hypothetical protein GW949_06800 [Spirochaetales bacterium]|nr:hypothetical protein [Spirochaetales bacterium]